VRNHRLVIICLVLSVLIQTSCSRQKGLDEVLFEEIPKLMELSDIPGFSIAVIRDGEIYWTGAFGVKSTETKESIDEETIFEAASLSKTVSAAAALKLVERGVLDLDTPLHEYFPSPRLQKDERYKKITARLVLTHTTGLPNWGTRLIREPGQLFGYSGEGFRYLGQVVEKLAGIPFQEFVQKEIFEPLDMTHSSYIWNDLYAENGAIGHDRHSFANPLRRNTIPNAGASLLTTPRDYAVFLCAILNGTLLKPETINTMLTPHVKATKWDTTEEDQYISWGFGWGIQPGSTENGFFHWGNNGDLRGLTLAYKNKKEGIIFFSNSENAFALAEPLLALLTDEPQWIFHWFDWPRYDDPERVARRSFEKAFLDEGVEAGMQKLTEVSEQFPDLIKQSDLLNTGRYLASKGKHGEAASLFNKFLETNPKSRMALREVTQSEMNRGSFREALICAEHWKATLPDDNQAERAIVWIKELVKASEEPVAVPLERLEKYAGDYGDRHVLLKEGVLYYHPEGRRESRLLPLSPDTFYLEDYLLFRLRFVTDAERNISYLNGIYFEGRTDKFERDQ
jgi:CubicO group peptidase (beta-lactamase class C family)